MFKSRFSRFVALVSMLCASAFASAAGYTGPVCAVVVDGLRAPTIDGKGVIAADPVPDDPGFGMISGRLLPSSLTGDGSYATMGLSSTAPGASNDPRDHAVLQEWQGAQFFFKFPASISLPGTGTGAQGYWMMNGVWQGVVYMTSESPMAWRLSFGPQATTKYKAREFKATCKMT